MSDYPTPITRGEIYLAGIAGEPVTLPEPITREEKYLAYIAENGGGGGTQPTADLHTLISTADEITTSILADDDYLGVDDTSDGVGKKLSVQSLKKSINNGLLLQADLTISTSAWGENIDAETKSLGYDYTADISIPGLLESANAKLTLAMSSFAVAAMAKICRTATLSAGILRLYAQKAPLKDLSGRLDVVQLADQVGATAGLCSINAPVPDDVLAIPNNGFTNCYSLTEASFPSCTIIGGYAFNRCSALSSLSFPLCKTISSAAFGNCRALKSVNFPVCETLGVSAFSYCSSLTSADFPACKTIGSSAFESCSRLARINFPSCKSIGGSAFANCASLTSADFPVCTTMGSSAFYSCSRLASINFPACTAVGNSAFIRCSSLESVSLQSCTQIGLSAFAMCYNLVTVVLPVCTMISRGAFYSCFNLISLYLPGSSLCSMGDLNAFNSTPISDYSASAGRYGSIYVPASMLTTYQTAYLWSWFSNRFVGLTDAELATLRG